MTQPDPPPEPPLDPSIYEGPNPWGAPTEQIAEWNPFGFTSSHPPASFTLEEPREDPTFGFIAAAVIAVVLGFIVFALTRNHFIGTYLLTKWWEDVLVVILAAVFLIWYVLRSRATIRLINRQVRKYQAYDEAKPQAEQLLIKHEWVDRRTTIRILLATMNDEERMEILGPDDNARGKWPKRKLNTPQAPRSPDRPRYKQDPVSVTGELLLDTRKKMVFLIAPIVGMVLLAIALVVVTVEVAHFFERILVGGIALPSTDRARPITPQDANNLLNSLFSPKTAVIGAIILACLVGLSILPGYARQRRTKSSNGSSSTTVKIAHSKLGKYVMTAMIVLSIGALGYDAWHTVSLTGLFHYQRAASRSAYGLPLWWAIGLWVLPFFYAVAATLRWRAYIFGIFTTALRSFWLWPGWLFWLPVELPILYADRIDFSKAKIPVLGQLFNYCTVGNDSAATEDTSFNRMTGIPNPGIVLRLIEGLVVQARSIHRPPKA
jgi:Ca2+/Na+ antiporter